MTDTSKIKPIYEDLQGRISQLPTVGGIEMSVWEHYNKTVERLNQVTEEDYNEYKAIPDPPSYYEGKMTKKESYPATEIRTKMMGLIMRLYGEHFSLEQKPFSVQLPRPG